MSGGALHPELRSGPHLFVDDLTAPELGADDDRHLRRVLRARPGEELTVSDGAGGWRCCVVTPDGLEVASEARSVPAPVDALTIAVAPPKGDRPEWLVQKLTELGIDRIVLLRTVRSVVRWEDDRVPKQQARFERVARSAAMQSRRCWLPVVEVGRTLADLQGPELYLADPDGGPLGDGVRAVAIGPEGGWAPEERERSAASLVGLGDSVLRTETAAVAAGVLLCARRSGVLGP